jgi:serine/threonine protein kinase
MNLNEQGAAGTPLSAGALPPTKSHAFAPDEIIGTRIGPYKLLQKIGEGGMGVVYMAEQEQPVRRKVALKIIKPGLDSSQVVARFEAERQALALMDHQNIARVLDAGTVGVTRDQGRGASENELHVYSRIYEQTGLERRRALRGFEQRRLRRSG